jgi:dienelactone hydrolase
MRAERIKYPMGALTAEGALIYDENVSGKRPAVLVAPNWMGMTDKAIQRGELVAGNRYVVFVADMYGAGTRPADFGEAPPWPTLCARTPSSSVAALKRHLRR